jgi:hypothetical protein
LGEECSLTALGVSEAEIEAALEWFERYNVDKLDPDVLHVNRRLKERLRVC